MNKMYKDAVTPEMLINVYENTPCVMVKNQQCILSKCPLVKCSRVEEYTKVKQVSNIFRVVNHNPNVIVDTSIIDRVVNNPRLKNVGLHLTGVDA